MNILSYIGVLILAYLIGSTPFGLLAVRLRTGKDIREIGSGRTGTTNAMRAAGYPIGVLTLILDILKGASVVWLARWIAPGITWLEIFAPVFAIVGHNYSIFLIERDQDGKVRLRGGAGGAPALGGAFGLWPPVVLILLPFGLLIFFGVGYASLATMSVPLIAAIVFAIRVWLGASPWGYVLYCLMAEALLLWALRPNIRSLLKGTERGVGWRARKVKEINDFRNG